MIGFKVVALLTKRADLTQEAFIDYYESRHAPLILASFPSIVAYRRNYADFTEAFASAAAPFDFDVVTEIGFTARAGYDDMLARHAQPAIAEAIAADETNFLDRLRTRMFVVEPRESTITQEQQD